MSARLRILLAGMALLALGACGGGDTETTAGAGATVTTESTATSSTTPAAELPQFASNFDRVCTTKVGFPGATTYEPGPGPHPVILFEEHRGKNFITASVDLPQGWAIKEDTNYQDNSELRAVQLIACSDRVKETPTGKQCDFESKGEKVKLELVDATYELTVYEAKTGKQVSKSTLEAKSDDCPYIAAYEKGDTTYVEEPSDDQYINALKPVVAP